MISIKTAVKEADLHIIENLAVTIWREHYTPIIGSVQVEYMLEKYQSFSAMKNQLENGHLYFTIYNKKKAIGYIGYQKRQAELFLSKIYILNEWRGRGIGKKAMQFILEQARTAGLPKIVLTVNKYNTASIQTYLKMGFVNTGPFVQDIGNGFIMDDYRMEKGL